MNSLHFTNQAIAGLITEGVLMLLLPFVFLLIWKIKSHERVLVPLMIGAATWFIFAILLKIAPAYLLLQGNNPIANAVRANVWLSYLVAGLLAGVFEETGRFLAFKFVLKKQTERRTAISYGLGHGGFESIYTGLQVLMLTALGMLLSSGLGKTILAEADEASLSVLTAQLGNYADLSFGECLLGVAERLSAMVMHISLSVFVFSAVRNKQSVWLFPTAAVLHALVDFSAAFYQSGYIPAWATELVMAAIAAGLACAAYRIYKKLPQKPVVAADYPAQNPTIDAMKGE